MQRINVVTGGASGIGKATVELLRSRGETVISVDIKDGDINADLTTEEGLSHYAESVERLSGGHVDAIFANAGLATPTVKTAEINYYGAIASVELIKHLMETSPAPRVVMTSSIASYMGKDDDLLALLLADNKDAALAKAAELAADLERANSIYGTTKHAISRWIRKHAVTAEFAGKGIALNGVGPGIIRTAMTADMLADPQVAAGLEATCPAPFHGPAADPVWIAQALAFLGSPENMFITGQVLFADGGAEATIRPELI